VRRAFLGLVAAMVTLLAAAPAAGATAQPAVHVSVGHPFVHDYPGFLIDQGTDLYSVDHDFPSDAHVG
jgi:hypothetical protein